MTHSLRIGLAALVMLTACATTTSDTTATTPSSTAPPTSAVPTTVAPTSSTSTTAAPTTTVPEGFTWPGSDGPDRYAVLADEQIQLVGFGNDGTLDIPSARTGVILGDDLIFGPNDPSGVWIWPPRPDDETAAPGGQDEASILIGEPDTGTSVWFHDAKVVGSNPLVLYREEESEATPIVERMMLYDLSDGQQTLLFDKATRRDDVGEDELVGSVIGDAALHSDGFAALFGFGDSTFIEWYDLGGNPEPSPPGVDSVEGTVLELAIADDKLVLGVETEFPLGITQLWMVDLETDEVTGPINHEVEGQSLRDLAFDGRWLTATIYGSSEEKVGSYFADFTNATAETSDDPVVIAPARDGQ